jgi:cyclomaltodextrinase
MELPCAAFAYKDMCKDVVYLAKDNHIELDMEPKSAYILIPCADNEKGVVKKMPKKIIKEEAPEQEVMPLPETKEEQAIVLPVIDMPITPGVYEHFKGKHYTVLYVAKHSETLESYVVYRQLYGNGEVWIRPLDMFLKDVEVDGKIVPRFKYIGK